MQVVECDRSRSPEILAILNDAILHTTALYDYRPRTPGMMDLWFDTKEKGNYPVLGAIGDRNELLGFASYGPFRAWPAYKYTIEHSVYVDREHRGKGVGKTLLAAILARARQQEFHTVIGGIDAENAVSIALHKRFGFEFCGRIRQAGYKFGRWLDLDFYQLILDTPRTPVDG